MDTMIRIVVVVLTILLSGCVESSFRLSKDSRLPVWFEIPSGQEHSAYTVTLDYYTSGKAVFNLISESDNKFVDRVVARVRDSKPLEEDGKTWPMGELANYPIYSVVTYEGVSEIIEHKERSPEFSLVDSSLVVGNVGCVVRNAGGFECEQNFVVKQK